jgi:hypothetical protein
MQTLAHRSSARALRRAACAALLVIALTSFAVSGTAVSARRPADGAGSSTARGGPSNSSIAAACFAAGSSGWRRGVIPLGSLPAITRTLMRYSDSARCAA